MTDLSILIPASRAEYKRQWRKKNRVRMRKVYMDTYWKNPEKKREDAKKHYILYREKELDRIRFSKYGISGNEFRIRLTNQKNKCPICEQILVRNPSVDHDHLTGKIRGLICNACNLAIGNAGDSPDRLRRMADYLEKVFYFDLNDKYYGN